MNFLKKIFTDKNYNKYTYNFLGFLFIIFVWIILSVYFDNSIVIPKISDVFDAFKEVFSKSRIYSIILKTIFRILLTVSASLVVSLLFSTLAFMSEKISHFLNPLMVVLKTIPIIAIIILLFMMINIKMTPYFATGFVVIPIMYEGMLATLKQIDHNITDDIKTVTNTNITVLVKFYIPLVFPSIITSIIQSFGLGFKVMLMAEFISPSRNTLGAEMSRYYNNNEMAKVFSLIIVILVIVLIVDKILKSLREKWYNTL